MRSNWCDTADLAANERREATACSRALCRCVAAPRCDASSALAKAVEIFSSDIVGGAADEDEDDWPAIRPTLEGERERRLFPAVPVEEARIGR